MSDRFIAHYSVTDGYVTGDRPQHFRIEDGDLQEDMTDPELAALFNETMQDHFEQHVYPTSKDEDRFVTWAREQLAKRVK